ncbi:hypothetical protein GKQ77_10675 [Streptomyces sp. BG9H]|uniref:Uncharacterized protein n=2 Tax=Streptomyces anatolicus TaxID=2675858 RepID=A0ABS6YKT9_9ACTN|nr:hypothetical protein [Streptomyces anatolicus]
MFLLVRQILDIANCLAAAHVGPWLHRAEHHRSAGEVLDVALGGVRSGAREGHIERLETFVEEHRARLEELLGAYGLGSRTA